MIIRHRQRLNLSLHFLLRAVFLIEGMYMTLKIYCLSLFSCLFGFGVGMANSSQANSVLQPQAEKPIEQNIPTAHPKAESTENTPIINDTIQQLKKGNANISQIISALQEKSIPPRMLSAIDQQEEKFYNAATGHLIEDPDLLKIVTDIVAACASVKEEDNVMIVYNIKEIKNGKEEIVTRQTSIRKISLTPKRVIYILDKRTLEKPPVLSDAQPDSQKKLDNKVLPDHIVPTPNVDKGPTATKVESIQPLPVATPQEAEKLKK